MNIIYFPSSSPLLSYCIVLISACARERLRKYDSLGGGRQCCQHQAGSTLRWDKLAFLFCSDRILTCRIKSIRSPAKVGLVVTDLITSPVVSWEGWETPPPPQHRGSAVILCSTTGVVRPLCSCGDLLLSSARLCLRFGGC